MILFDFASFIKVFHRIEQQRKSTMLCFFAKIPLVFQRNAFLSFPIRFYRISLRFLTVFHRMWPCANLPSENADFAVFSKVFIEMQWRDSRSWFGWFRCLGNGFSSKWGPRGAEPGLSQFGGFPNGFSSKFRLRRPADTPPNWSKMTKNSMIILTVFHRKWFTKMHFLVDFSLVILMLFHRNFDDEKQFGTEWSAKCD